MSAPEKLVAVEYHGGHPHSVTTTDGKHWTVYDFNWCKRDGTCYYRDVGGGPAVAYSVGRLVGGGRAEIWLDQSIQNFVDGGGRPLTRRQVVKYGYDFLAELKGDPFDDVVEGATTWCEVCEDHLPDENQCRHMVFVAGEGLLGCGTCEREPELHMESLQKLLQALGREVVARLLSNLTAGGAGWECWCPGGEADQLHLRDPVTCEDVGRDLDSEKAEAAGIKWDDLFVGMAWLASLEPGKTKKAVRLTILWMRAWLRGQKDGG